MISSRPILITGSAGFVGSRMVPQIERAFPGQTVMGVSRTRKLSEKHHCFDLAEESITRAFLGRYRPKIIIHLAAFASVGGAHKSPSSVWRDNRDTSFSLARAAAATVPDATILVSSTSEIYGNAFLGGPVNESTKPLPRGPYATSKLAGEEVFCALLSPTNRLVICRPVNHTGRGQREDFVVPSLAAQVARIEMGLMAPTISVGNLSAYRDFLDVSDVISAYIALLAAHDTLPLRTVVNVASGHSVSIRSILDFFLRQARCPITERVDETRMRPNDIPRVDVDTKKMLALSSWTPSRSLEDTLMDVLTDKRESVAQPEARYSEKRRVG
ncbi:MAG: NAD-dependent epimerase/dehydratase family protein [Pseudomonadota bacterium]